MQTEPTMQEIARVYEWLRFNEIKGLLAELLLKYAPTQVNIGAIINAWGEEMPPHLVKADLLLILSNLLPQYELLCQPEINN